MSACADYISLLHTTSCVKNFTDMAREAGVSADTIKRLLEEKRSTKNELFCIIREVFKNTSVLYYLFV